MAFSSKIAVLLTVAVLAVTTCRVAEGQSSCVNQLIPCAEYLNSTRPAPVCCNAIRSVISTQLDCLCRLYNNPSMVPGINITQALMLPRYCNLSSDTSICRASAPGGSPVRPPVTPGGSNGDSGNGNGAASLSWMGVPALLFASAFAFLY